MFFIAFILLTSSIFAQDFKRNPVVYAVHPNFISATGELKGLESVRRRLPEIKSLGATVVWLQPITPPADEDGPGYDVLDYTKVWPQLGSEEDLKKLVQEAHELGLKIILDVVLNHSSVQHPFVLDIQSRGQSSRYYEFYQHEKAPKVPYAEYYNELQVGSSTFIYYFWDHLINFNFQSKKLRTYLFDAMAYWVKTYNIDGFRFDASWGPSARWPQFYRTLSAHLRKIKPDLILLAEDSAGYPGQYQGSGHPHLKNSGFDWAYDWKPDSDSLATWSFAVDDDDPTYTVFNLNHGRDSSEKFLKAVKNGAPVEGIKVLRFIENNDTPGILMHHSQKDARWAAKVMFLLPGVPMLYYGQETGIKRDLHEDVGFDDRRQMKSYNPKVWSFYQRMIALRKKHNILSEGEIHNLKRESRTVISYQLVSQGEKVKVRLDFANKKALLNGELIE